MLATLTSKYQVTIPRLLRDILGLHVGDKLDFAINEGGVVTVLPVSSSITQLKGMVPKPKKAASLEEMQRGILKGAARAC